MSVPSTPTSATPLRTPRSATGSSKRSLDRDGNPSLIQIEPATPPPPASTSSPRSPLRPQINVSGLSAAGASTPARASSPPATSPVRTSQTHAGGILPPASFFRASRPNSSANYRPPSSGAYHGASPLRTSGIGLPFKAPSPGPPTAGTAASPSRGLPSSFNKPLALEIGRGGAKSPGSVNRSREPLLPVGEDRAPQQQQPSRPGAGVRKSFERIWKKGMNVASGPAPAVPSTPAKTETEGGVETDDDKRSWVEQEERRGEKEDVDLEAGVVAEEEDRNRYVQPEEDNAGAEADQSRRLTIDDIGDGAAGGGVVMEMGRLSIASPPSIRSVVAASLRSVSFISTSKRRTEDLESINDAEIRFASSRQVGVARRGSVDSPVRSPPATAVASSFEMHHQPSLASHHTHHQKPRSLTTTNRSPPPSSPLAAPPSARHARFAPSPARSPKVEAEALKSSASSVTSSGSKEHIPHTAVFPKYMVPLLSPKTKRPIRNYEFHPSSNRYFFSGHVLTGGDSAWPFIGALAVLLGIAGAWMGTTCVFWWQRGGGGQAVAAVGAYLILITVSSMLMTAFRDPGILPRDLDPDPPYPPVSSATSDSNPVPLPRDLRVRAGSVRVKYCVTCRTYRPPRSSHCKICDNCVDGCDHHCQWVNNCVGRRNYTYFITFVCTASISTILVLVTAFLHIYLLTRDDGYTVKVALKHAVGSTVVICLCLVVLWPILALTLYHVRLLLLNITTIEQVRNQAHKKLTQGPTPPNPFTLGRWWHNVAYMVCRPAGYSWIDFAGQAMHDTRKINPGFVVRPTSAVVDGGGDSTADNTPRESRERTWR